MKNDELLSLTPTVNNGKEDSLLNCFRKVSLLSLRQDNCTQQVHLYALENDKYRFDYAGLIRLLKNNVASYVFSRRTYKEYVDSDTLMCAVLDAQKKLISVKEDAIEKKNFGSGGELGELLLYIFFESFLYAPKLLSKVELKTNNNDYVKGFDGIHFRVKHYDSYSAYQIVYGEAKIKAKIEDAVADAFESLKECLSKEATDWGLIDGKLFDEVLTDKKQAEALRTLLIPKYRSASNKVEFESAYGIFIGYSFAPPQNESCAPKEAIDIKIQQDIDSVKSQIIKLIQSMPEVNSDYYIFFLPFNNAVEDKHKIMQQIAGVTVNESK